MEKFNKEIWETFGEKFENVNTLSQRVDAVSYTHLDVYKRQEVHLRADDKQP